MKEMAMSLLQTPLCIVKYLDEQPRHFIYLLA